MYHRWNDGVNQPGPERGFIGRYRVMEGLGASRLGVSYLVAAGERFASLLLLDALPMDIDGRMLSRFREVMALVQSLNHANIIPIHDTGDVSGIPYVVTEHLEHGALVERVGFPRRVRDVLPYAQGIGNALDFAHSRGVVHGSLNPRAIFLRHNGAPVITGFGLAALEWMVPPARRAALGPTPLSLSPEQRAGDPATTRSDVWAFAAILWELLTGHAPWEQVDFGSFRSGLPSELDMLLRAALSEQPDTRPAAAGQLVRGLSTSLADEQTAGDSLLLRRWRTPELVTAGTPASRTEPIDKRELPPERRFSSRMERGHSAPYPGRLNTALRQQRVSYQSQQSVRTSPLASQQGPVPRTAPRVMNGGRRLRPGTFARHSVSKSIAWLRTRPVEAVFLCLAVGILLIGTARFVPSAPATQSVATISNLTTSSPAGSWTMTGQNPARTAYAAEIGNTPEGKVVWQAALGAPVTSPPVVAGNLVYVGLADGRTSAYDATTGTLRWEYKASGPILAGPAVADGLTYIGLKDGRVLALDSASGGIRWEYRTGGPVTGSVVVVEGVLYAGSEDGRLYALDAAAGTLRWDYDAGSAITAPPSVANGLVLVATQEGRLHMLDYRTGKARWVYRTGGAVEGPALLTGGFAYIATDRGTVHAIDPFAKGTPFEWELRELQAQLYLWGLPVGLPGPQPGYKWSASTESPVHAPMAAAGALILVPGSDGQLTAFNALTGEKRWTYRFGGPISGGPIVAGDLVYVGAEDKKVAVLNAATGQKLLEIALTGQVRVSPALSNGMLFLGTGDGKLYAIK